MRNERTNTSIEDLLLNPEITLLYRNNSLYRAVSDTIVRTLKQLGFRVNQMVLDEGSHAKKIRAQARSIIRKDGASALVLPDHTCWRALTTERDKFPNLKYPFEHLDTILSDAAIASMFPRTSIPPSLATVDILSAEHIDAITQLFTLIKAGGFKGDCHVIQPGIAEHAPFVISLIKSLMQATPSEDFPPDRSQETIKIACDQVEEPLALKVAEAIARADIRTNLHQTHMFTSPPEHDLVVCDLHFAESHRGTLGKTKVLPLPMASLIAQACEYSLLPTRTMDQLTTDLEIGLRNRHAKMLEKAQADLAQAK